MNLKRFNEIPTSQLKLQSVSYLFTIHYYLKRVVGQGLAFLRESHGGCNSPPDCCQVPPFESILAPSPHKLNRVSLDSYLTLFEEWWAKMDSNHRPHDYQSCALAS